MYIGEYEKGFNDYKKLSDIRFLNEPKIFDECIEYNKNLIEDEPDSIWGVVQFRNMNII